VNVQRARVIAVTLCSVAALRSSPAHAQGRTWGVADDNEQADSQSFPTPREPAPIPAPNEPNPPEPPPDVPPLGRAFLDYSDGTFYLRSAHDNLIIATGGRVHIDTYVLAGGENEPPPPNMFFRRFILESGGLIRKHWFFWVGGNFAPTSLDANQASRSTAAVYDGFVGYQWPHLQLYVGQYNAPFTMENVTSSRWLDMMERALVVRTVATPYNKDLGVLLWGATGDGVAPLEYQLGVFGGDGMNRPNVDHRADVMARVLYRPLASATKDAVHRAHVGISGRAGSRAEKDVIYDAPTLSTPGGYVFWSPRHKEGDLEVHAIPSGNQAAGGAELYLPFERWDVKSEVIYVHDERREASADDRHGSFRRGTLSGFGGYAQLSLWAYGAVRVNGQPAGRYIGIRAPKDRGNEFPFGLQLVLRGEMMRLTYDSNARSREVDGATTDIDVTAIAAGANYWATKHVRVTGQYALYTFSRGDALHEIAFRLGLAL
jgi:phosphate-selective porin